MIMTLGAGSRQGGDAGGAESRRDTAAAYLHTAAIYLHHSIKLYLYISAIPQLYSTAAISLHYYIKARAGSRPIAKALTRGSAAAKGAASS